MVFYRDLRNYGLVVLAIVAALVALYAVSRPTGLHLTRAEVLQQATRGYAPPPRTIDPAALQGQWQSVVLPYAPRPNLVTEPAPEASSPTTTTWYRFRLPPEPALAREAYVYIPRWKTDGEFALYVNGALQYQSHANLQWNGSNQPLWIALDSTADGKRPDEIVIRMRHVRGLGGALSTLWVGGYGQIGAAYLVRNFIQSQLPYLMSTAFLGMGIFAAFVWLKRRQDTLYLFFFAMTAATFIRSMHHYMGLQRLPISDAWFGWLTVNSIMWMMASIHFFLIRIHHRRLPVLTGALVAMTAVFALATLPLLAGTVDATLVSPVMYPAMYVMGNVVCAFGFYWSWRIRSVEGVALAGWAFLTTQLGAFDWLLQNNFVNIENLFMSVYALIATIVAFGHIVLKRYTAALGEAERSNQVLAERLTEREAELVASHQKLRAIERRELLLEERQRLMQDMHDGLGSSLVTALRVVEHGQIDEREIAQILRGCIDDLKLTIDSMEPAETDLLLLLGTLRFRLQPRLESTGIGLRWDVGDTPPLDWLDQRHALHILRILQEAFTNVIKHSGATAITVTTALVGDTVAIGITDNGCGFDTAQAKSGRGLSNQARRAEVIGGRIELAPGNGGGTCFRLLLPVAQRAAPVHEAVKT